jgi:hypothetical protein
MTLLAKSVIKNKCWIVEDGGSKVATILATEQGVTLVQGTKRESFSSLKLLSDRYNIVIDKARTKNSPGENHTVYNYPVKGKAYNQLWNVKKRLPVFTKNPKSKSFYCAGHYVVKYNAQWVYNYCPKLITLNRYEYCGPFKTKEELNLYIEMSNESTGS